MTSSLKRTGVSSYIAMVVTKSTPLNWNAETLLIRFVDNSGTSTVFVISGDALPIFKKLEQWRIYELQIPGKCVRQKNSMLTFGIRNTQEVVMKFQCKVVVAKESWPFVFPYQFHSWSSLNQVETGVFIDICGQVFSKPTLDASSSLSKLTVVLCNADLTEEVYFLGEQAHTRVNIGDVVALGGVRLSTYREQRMLQTSFLTVIEINPSTRHDEAFTIECSENEPKRKAIKMSFPATKTVNQVQQLVATTLENLQTGLSPPVLEFTLVGHLKKMTSSFFAADVPIVEAASKELMCWQATFSDSTGCLQVKVWDKACNHLFLVTAYGLRNLWEKGIDDPDQQNEVLKQLNNHLENKVTCFCSVVGRKYGKNDSLFNVQININNLEVTSDE
jgi:hypothetical protein